MSRDRVHLLDILDRGQRILEYTQEGREHFLEDLKTQDAVIRSFEVIGEACKRLSAEIREQAPEIPWIRIGGFRDVLIHEYAGVDLEQVWLRVERDLPELLDVVRRLVKGLE